MQGKAIIVKLVAIAAFLGGIVGGGVITYNAATVEDWARFGIGLGLVVVGVTLVAALAPWIAKADGKADWEAEEGAVGIKTSIVVAAIALFTVSAIVFIFVGVSFWVARGWWRLGVLSCAWFVVMLFTCMIVSGFWQTRGARAVRRDPEAKACVGTVTAVRGKFPILLIGKTLCLLRSVSVSIDGKTATAVMRNSGVVKRLRAGDTVEVLFNPQRPRFCSIVGERKEESRYA